VSPALNELQKKKLIQSAGGDAKTKYYIANPNVLSVVREVLVHRERRLLETSIRSYKKLRLEVRDSEPGIDLSRLEDIGAMIAAASLGLDTLLENVTQESLPSWKLIAKAI